MGVTLREGEQALGDLAEGLGSFAVELDVDAPLVDGGTLSALGQTEGGIVNVGSRKKLNLYGGKILNGIARDSRTAGYPREDDAGSPPVQRRKTVPLEEWQRPECCSVLWRHRTVRRCVRRCEAQS